MRTITSPFRLLYDKVEELSLWNVDHKVPQTAYNSALNIKRSMEKKDTLRMRRNSIRPTLDERHLWLYGRRCENNK
jgi:hypothetical protein